MQVELTKSLKRQRAALQVEPIHAQAEPVRAYRVLRAAADRGERTGPGGAAPTDPTSAAFATYYGSYHGVYEPPFCVAQARALFDTVK